MVGIGEVASYRKSLFELLVAMELGAIIERDRLEAFPMLAYGLHAGPVHLFDGTSLYLLDDKEASFSFDERNDAMMAVAADHGIAFPVPDACSMFNLHRPFLDHAFAL